MLPPTYTTGVLAEYTSWSVRPPSAPPARRKLGDGQFRTVRGDGLRRQRRGGRTVLDRSVRKR